METLPVTVITESEAREIARELAHESLADIPHLRQSLSVLTSMGAQLAAALEQRNREYEALLARLPQGWLDLPPGTRFPDPGQLRVDLAQAVAVRDQAAAQLAEQEALVAELEKQLEAARKSAKSEARASKKNQAALEKSLSQATERVAELQVQIAAADQARAGLAQDVEARQQELNDLEGRLDRWQGSLVLVLADTESPVAVDTEIVAGAVAKAGQLDGLLQGVTSQARQTHQRLGDARARIADMQSELVAALAAREALDGQLATREMVLSDLNHQIERQGEKLQAIVPLELTQPAEGEGLRLIGITALADTVDKVIQASANQAVAAVELEDQVNGLAAEKASLEASLQEQEAALAAAQQQVQALQGTVDDLNAQIQALQVERDNTRAEKGELQQAVEKLEEQVNGLAAEKASLEASLQEQEAALATARQQVQVLQGTVDDLNAQIQVLQVDRNNAYAEKDELQQTLAMREGELAAARQQVADLQTQVAATEAQLQEVQAQIGGLQAQMEAESGELNELRSRAAMIWPFETRSALALALEDRPAVKREAASAALVAGAEPQVVPHVQDLSKVKGIGAARRQRLYNSGVGTYWELAHIPDEAMQQILELTKTQSATFDFPVVRAEAYQLARDTDSLGWIWEGQRVDDFEPMAGIGATYEQRLYEHGIYTYQQLADTSEEQLAQIIDAPEMQQPDYAGWIAEAEALAEQQRQAAIESLRAEVEEESTELPGSTASA